jgi:hypothetical protein
LPAKFWCARTPAPWLGTCCSTRGRLVHLRPRRAQGLPLHPRPGPSLQGAPGGRGRVRVLAAMAVVLRRWRRRIRCILRGPQRTPRESSGGEVLPCRASRSGPNRSGAWRGAGGDLTCPGTSIHAKARPAPLAGGRGRRAHRRQHARQTHRRHQQRGRGREHSTSQQPARPPHRAVAAENGWSCTQPCTAASRTVEAASASPACVHVRQRVLAAALPARSPRRMRLERRGRGRMREETEEDRKRK